MVDNYVDIKGGSLDVDWEKLRKYAETTMKERAEGGKWQPSYITTGYEVGGFLWREREAESKKLLEAQKQREALSEYLDEQARQLKIRQSTQRKAEQETQDRLRKAEEERRARATGISIRQYKEQQVQQRAEEQRVIKVASDLRGQNLTRSQFQRELSKRSGLSVGIAVSRLQTGTRREAKIFRRTGVSLEEERRKEQPTDPVRQMLKADDREEGTKFLEAPLNFGEDIRFSFRDIQYGYPLEEGKISPQAYVEYKAKEVTRRMSDWLKEKTPQKIKDIPLTGDIRRLGISAIETVGKPFLSKEQRELFELGLKEKREAIKPTTVGEFMFEKEIPFRHTDLMKFGLFMPFMQPTQASLQSAISRGDIKPITETRFKAIVKQADDLVDDISRVEVISTTKVGGKTVGGISKQLIRTQGDDLTIGIGKGIIVEAKGGGAREITKFDIIGINKRLGVARAIKDYSDDALNIALKKDIGTGVQSKVITQETSRLLRREGLGIVKRYKALSYSDELVSSELLGIIKPSQQKGITYYVGQTTKPTTRISKYGVYKILDEPNVAGIIKEISKMPDDVIGLIQPAGIKKTPLSKTFAVSAQKATQQSITQQVSALAKQSEKVIFKELIKPKGTKSILRTITTLRTPLKPKQRFADQTRRMFAEIDIQRFEPLGDLSRFESLEVLGRVKAGVKAKAKARAGIKARQKTELKSLLDERELLKELTGVKARQVYRTRQAQRLRLNLRQQLKQDYGRGTFFGVPIKLPKTTIPIIPIIPISKFKRGKRKKVKKKPTKFKGDLFYVAGATARFLNIQKVMSERELLARVRSGGIGLRPILIRRKKRTKKRKGGRRK